MFSRRALLSPLGGRWLRGLAALALGLGLTAFGAPLSTAAPAVPPPAQPRVMVPEFPAGAAWLNTEKPLSLRALRGKVVLLDFWTYGCINCMHILPDLKRLERKYPNELVVISVHTAKFVNEDETANIRNAVLRYNIEHPILNDAGRRYWDTLGVRVWPTQVLIDPAGYFVGAVTGEGQYDVVDRAIARVIQEAKVAGRLDTRPVRFALEAAKAPETPLWYPGKVLADTGTGGSGKIFIADTNHNRIVIANASGEVEAVAGSGAVGKVDGAFDTAQFSSPQGMALRRAPDGALTLLVADTNNHSIRALDLRRGIVSTTAGTGKQASVVRKNLGGSALTTSLASPWDLLLEGDRLYIAMAGPHQIWAMDLTPGRVLPYAGSGMEARTDGALLTSAFAQPSGLASDGKRLFVADSEISAIRTVDLPGGAGQVRTIAGGDLFDFGDVDGPGATARLQHPLGVAYADGLLYIADTYNHKIKRFNVATGIVETFVGGGKGEQDGAKAQFYEPGGISLAGKKLYVADTNNHRIRIVDVDTRAVTTLALKNLPRPLPAEPERAPAAESQEKDVVRVPTTQLAAGAAGELVLNLRLPAGYKLNADSPHRFEVRVEGQGVTLPRTTVPAADFKLPLRLPLTSGKIGERGTVVLSTTVFYCSDKQTLCRLKRLRFRAPFEVAEGGAKALTIAADL